MLVHFDFPQQYKHEIIQLRKEIEEKRSELDNALQRTTEVQQELENEKDQLVCELQVS